MTNASQPAPGGERLMHHLIGALGELPPSPALHAELLRLAERCRPPDPPGKGAPLPLPPAAAYAFLPASRHLARNKVPYYFSGVECHRGHMAPRRTAHGGCIACESMRLAIRIASPAMRDKLLADWEAAKRAEQPAAA